MKNIQAEMNNLIKELFENFKLNVIGHQLIDLEQQYRDHMSSIKGHMYQAFEARWKQGKIISENHDLIIEECGTQEEFAKRIGQTPAVVSNNKRAYENLLAEDCETWNEVIELLESEEIKPTVRNFEKIGTLLNEPKESRKRQEQIDRDRRRLEELRSEAEEILRRNEPTARPEFLQDAFEFVEDIEEIKEYIESFDVKNTRWRSEKYLNFVRNFGVDLITMKQCEKCDPHHTTPEGGSGATGEKLPDYYTIPVSRDTHNRLESGTLDVTPEQILRAQFITLTSFLTLNMK